MNEQTCEARFGSQAEAIKELKDLATRTLDEITTMRREFNGEVRQINQNKEDIAEIKKWSQSIDKLRWKVVGALMALSLGTGVSLPTLVKKFSEMVK